MKTNPAIELFQLSRRASHAPDDQRAGIREAFDSALQKISAVGTLDPRGTWSGSSPVNNIISERSVLAISTWFNCIRNISEDCGKLPFNIFDVHEDDDGRDYKKRIKDELWYLINCEPNEHMDGMTFRTLMWSWECGWGTAYAQIEWKEDGTIHALWPIHPNRVVARQNHGVFVFDIYNDDGTITKIPDSDMFRFHWMSNDGYTGMSPMQVYKNTLEFASAQERYAQHFMRNMGRPAGVLQTDETLKPQARNNLKQTWAEQYTGPLNAGKTPVLESGLKYSVISAPMKDAEFVSQWRFSKERFAECFRMPLRKLQDAGRAAGWSTLDAEESDYVSSCLMPHITRFESAIRRQLMPKFKYAITVHPKFNIHGLLRGDMASRSAFLDSMQDRGVISPNERREWEDLNPVNNSAMDKTYVNGAYVPIELAGVAAASAASGVQTKKAIAPKHKPNIPEEEIPNEEEDD